MTQKVKSLYGFSPELAPFAGKTPTEQAALLRSWGSTAVFGGYQNPEFVEAVLPAQSGGKGSPPAGPSPTRVDRWRTRVGTMASTRPRRRRARNGWKRWRSCSPIMRSTASGSILSAGHATGRSTIRTCPAPPLTPARWPASAMILASCFPRGTFPPSPGR